MEGTIVNNLGETIQYQLLSDPTTPANYTDLPNGSSMTLTDSDNLLVLRLPGSNGFDFTKLNNRISYSPVQFRRETDQNGNKYEVFVFEYTINSEVEGTGGDGDDDGEFNPPSPPIPA